MTKRNLSICITLILAMGIILIISAITGNGFWLFFIVPVFLCILVVTAKIGQCQKCQSLMLDDDWNIFRGFEPKSKSELCEYCRSEQPSL